MQGGDGGQTIARVAAAPSAPLRVGDLYGEAALAVDGGKTVLVGGVVSGINRDTAGKGRLGEKFGDRLALVAAARHEFDHLAALDQAQPRLRGGDFPGAPPYGGAVMGGAAVVGRQAPCLFLWE